MALTIIDLLIQAGLYAELSPFLFSGQSFCLNTGESLW